MRMQRSKRPDMNRRDSHMPPADAVRERIHPEQQGGRIREILEETVEGCAVRDKAEQIGEHEQVRRTLESGKVFLNESGKLISQGLQSGTEKMMENEKIASVVNKAGKKLDSIREDERVQEGMDKLRDTAGKTAERIQRFFNKKR